MSADKKENLEFLKRHKPLTKGTLFCIIIWYLCCGGVAQWIEYRTTNALVAGSTPVTLTTSTRQF